MFLSLFFRQVTDTVVVSLLLVLKLGELSFIDGFLGFEFFEFRTWLVHTDNLLYF